MRSSNSAHTHRNGYLSGEGLRGFFVYLVVLFGIKSGPLLWCRTAAFLMRLTAALVQGTPTLLACFVDDPIVVTAGPRPARRKIMWVILLFWRTLGFELAWDKGVCDVAVEWIGVRISSWRSSTGKHGVLITLPVEKFVKLRELIEALLASEPTVC